MEKNGHKRDCKEKLLQNCGGLPKTEQNAKKLPRYMLTIRKNLQNAKIEQQQ